MALQWRYNDRGSKVGDNITWDKIPSVFGGWMAAVSQHRLLVIQSLVTQPELEGSFEQVLKHGIHKD